MLKLKNLLSENVWDRKFGEALPTLEDAVKKHQVTEHTVTLRWKNYIVMVKL